MPIPETVPEFDAETEAKLSGRNSGKGKLQRIALALLLDHHEAGELPTSNRFLFYELHNRGICHKVKSGRGTAHKPGGQELSEATKRLRDEGLVPWEWIVDETRTLHQWSHARSVYAYINRELEGARINPWPTEPPLLLMESLSLAGVLRHDLSRYLVPLAATRGHVGGFLYTDVAPLLEGNRRPVIYLGDLDFQGGQIEENTKNVLVRAAGRPIDWTRIAITEEQVRERDLPWTWKTDDRFSGGKLGKAWECEALGQGEIVKIVTQQLDSLLPEPLEDIQAREDEQRAAVRQKLNA